MPDFFLRTRKKLGGGGGELYLYPNFLCVLKEYYCVGGGNSAQFFYAYLEGGVILKFLVCNERILLRVWGGAYARFFMRTEKLLGRGGRVIPKFLVCTQRILLRVWGGGLCQIFLCVLPKNIRRRGGGVYTQIFGVYSKNITASVGGGGGLCQIFFA